MRVALNLLHLVPGETGGSELYARGLVPALLAARPGLELIVFAAREGAPSLASEPWAARAKIETVPVNARSRARRVAAEQTLLAACVRRARCDLLHNLFSTAPAFPGVPQVTTIHDVIYKRFPETHAGLLARGIATLVPLAARRSRRVIAVSGAARDDIVRFLGVPTERVDVTHQGPGMPSGVAPLAELELRERLGIEAGAPIVLSVSAKRPHKNLERLIDAIARVEASPAPVLVVPGYATAFEVELERHADRARARERVRFAGWVDDATLEGLYAAATCFAFPSLAEGFGLPALEAMLRGTPLACSDASSLPEVAGEAARYFDPTDVDAIAAAIGELLSDTALRSRLAEAGRAQARKFTWEATAAATLASYDRALESAR